MVSDVVPHSQETDIYVHNYKTDEDSEKILGSQCENSVPDLGEQQEKRQGGLPYVSLVCCLKTV